MNNIKLVLPKDMGLQEAEKYISMVNQENLVELEIRLDGAEVVLCPKYNTIKRIRRITGYLSELQNFNDGKKAEEKDRIKHFSSVY